MQKWKSEYSCCLATVTVEIAALYVQEQELKEDPSDHVETSADDSSKPLGQDEMDVDNDMPANKPAEWWILVWIHACLA